MEERYAILAKKIALVVGLAACIIFFTVLFTQLFKKEEPDRQPFFDGQSMTHENSDISKGKELFINNCAQCHHKNMKDRLKGPPLYNWRDYFKDENELWTYLKDNKTYLSKNKNKKLKQLLKDYQGAECMNFPSLTLQDVQNIVNYIR